MIQLLSLAQWYIRHGLNYPKFIRYYFWTSGISRIPYTYSICNMRGAPYTWNDPSTDFNGSCLVSANIICSPLVYPDVCLFIRQRVMLCEPFHPLVVKQPLTRARSFKTTIVYEHRIYKTREFIADVARAECHMFYILCGRRRSGY